jgi:hypothetical protein
MLSSDASGCHLAEPLSLRADETDIVPFWIAFVPFHLLTVAETTHVSTKRAGVVRKKLGLTLHSEKADGRVVHPLKRTAMLHSRLHGPRQRRNIRDFFEATRCTTVTAVRLVFYSRENWAVNGQLTSALRFAG